MRKSGVLEAVLWQEKLEQMIHQIEKIKQEYTDKYVVVDGERPELARFSQMVGRVKTVNMSGRALVEFDDYHKNIGWYDIDLDYLKVVDKPAPIEKAEKAARQPAAKPVAKKASGGAEKKLSPLEMARMQDAGSKPKAKPSTADILAAARGKAPAAKSEPKAAAPAKAAPSAKVDRSKMSVADMLAAARGQTTAPAAEEEQPAALESTAEEAPAAEAAPAAKSGDVVKVDKSSMSVEEMVAYCREKDAS
ncbi:MAG: hypothetical protein KDA57_14610 [Planctomycetales bacterium]|nr:hypothetical protein [Planctomycetales bacterium]